MPRRSRKVQVQTAIWVNITFYYAFSRILPFWPPSTWPISPVRKNNTIERFIRMRVSFVGRCRPLHSTQYENEFLPSNFIEIILIVKATFLRVLCDFIARLSSFSTSTSRRFNLHVARCTLVPNRSISCSFAKKSSFSHQIFSIN